MYVHICVQAKSVNTPQVQRSREELGAAAAAADAGHREYAALLSRCGEMEVAAARMRRDYDTDEILLASQKQQVRNALTV